MREGCPTHLQTILHELLSFRGKVLDYLPIAEVQESFAINDWEVGVFCRWADKSKYNHYQDETIELR
jgi:hypothetical protein